LSRARLPEVKGTHRTANRDNQVTNVRFINQTPGINNGKKRSS
jgi:hypothetical protein